MIRSNRRYLEFSRVFLAVLSLAMVIGCNPQSNAAYSPDQDIKQIEKLSTAIKENPEEINNYIQRARISLRLDRPNDALTDAQKVQELDPKHRQTALLLGMAYYRLKQNDQAMNWLNKQLRRHFDDAEALQYRGGLHDRSKNYAAANLDYEAALRHEPDRIDVWFWFSQSLVEQERYQQAYDQVTQILAKISAGKWDMQTRTDLKMIWLYQYQSLASNRLGRFNDAIASASRGLELENDDACLLANRADAYKSLGKFEQAIKDSKRLVKLLPSNHVDIQKCIIEMIQKAHGIEPAIEQCTSWLGTSSDPDILLARGALREKQGETELAHDDYQTALKQSPNHWQAQHHLDQIKPKYQELLARKAADAKLIELNESIKSDPENADLYWQLGEHRFVQQQTEAALLDFRKALELDPNEPKYLISIGASLKKLERYDKAIETFGQAIERDKKNWVAYEFRGRCYQLKLDFRRAIDDLSKVLEQDDSRYDLHSALAYSKWIVGESYSTNLEKAKKQTSNDLARREMLQLERDIELARRGNYEHVLRSSKRSPDDVDAWIKMGDMKMRKERHLSAFYDYGKALKSDPNHVAALTKRTVAALACYRTSDAFADIQKAIRLAPEDPELYVKKGFVLRDLKRFDEAKESIEKAIELAPDYERAKNVLAQLSPRTTLEQHEQQIKMQDLRQQVDDELYYREWLKRQR